MLVYGNIPNFRKYSKLAVMKKSYPAPQVNEKFIDVKIERAFIGLSYLKVTNDGKFYALLKKQNDEVNYIYHNGLGEFKSYRSLEALKTIFTGLINKFQNFECDEVRYYVNRNTGEWVYSNLSKQ